MPAKRKPERLTLDQAKAAGYAIISRASCWAARVDHPDWRERMADSQPGGDRWVKALGASAANHYRRCHSRDVIVVPASWVRQLPNSDIGPTEFAPKESAR